MREIIREFIIKLRSSKLLNAGVLTVLLISVFTTIGLLKYSQDLRQRAQTVQQEEKVNKIPDEPEFISNELLIKFKKEVKGEVKENHEDTGIASLDEKFKQHKVKEFKKVAKEGKNSIKDADIFRWYKVTLDGESRKIKKNTDNYDKSVDADLLRLEKAKSDLLSDPSIETVEYNNVVYITQTSSPIPSPDLTVESIDITPVSPTVGSPVIINVRVKNQGNTNASGFWVNYYLNGSDFGQQSTGSEGLAAGASKDMSTLTWYPTAGPYTFKVVVDPPFTDGPNGWVIESNENNNEASKVFTVISLPTSTPIPPTPTLQPTSTPIPLPTFTPIPTPISYIPSDPYYHSTGSWGQTYPDLWGIKKINAEGAWSQTTGSDQIVVADIDTGVDRNHEDIASNMWVNVNDPIDGQDNDQNGYIDDYYGWDFVNNDNDPMDDHGHGTHTAGTIAATGNNGVGVVGVNWKAKIMALKFLDNSGSGYSSNAVLAMQYAADMGARVSSNSWGGSYSQIKDDAVRYEHERGMIVVVAAGNSNIDALDYSPASSDLAITVAASDSNDSKASFSNWGEKIDVAAPGVDVLSIKAAVSPMCTAAKIVGTNYCRVSGTSMATPHVSGLAAILLSKNPFLTNEEIRQILRLGADDLGPTGKDREFGYGRLDAKGSIDLTQTPPLVPIIKNPRSRTVISGTTLSIAGGISGPGFANYIIEASAGRAPNTWLKVYESNTQITDGILGVINISNLADDRYIFRLTATDLIGHKYQFQVHDVEIDNFDLNLTKPFGLVAKGTVEIIGTAASKNNMIFQNYTLEWGEGENPTIWSNSGIILMNGGSKSVINGLLGTWETSSLQNLHTYTLRLTLNGDGASSQYSIKIKFDQDLVVGWPKDFDLYSNSNNAPAIADLDGDGQKEVVMSFWDKNLNKGQVAVFKKDGQMLNGFPVAAESAYYYFDMPINIADLDQDGKQEIVLSVRNSYDFKIYVLKSDGTFYPGWPSPLYGGYYASDPTPVVVDLDLDGKKELVFLERFDYQSKSYLHALRFDGTELFGFPKLIDGLNLYFEETGAISANDLNGDNKPELLIGNANKFYVFTSNGDFLTGWPFTADNYEGQGVHFKGLAVSGDIDKDGSLEIFVNAMVGVNDSYCRQSLSCEVITYGWKKDGTLIPGWPKKTGNFYHPVLSGISMADIIDNDGRDEIVTSNNGIRVYDSFGEKIRETTNFQAQIAVSMADVNNDGDLEFTSVSRTSVSLMDKTGQHLWWRDFPEEANIKYYHPFSPAFLADLDNNRRMELITLRPFSVDKTRLYIWELPFSADISSSWPMFGHDSARTGNLSTSTVLPTPTSTPAPTSAPSGIIVDKNTVEVTLDKVNSYYGLIYGEGFKITSIDASGWQIKYNEPTTGQGFYESSSGTVPGRTDAVRSYINSNKSIGTYTGSAVVQYAKNNIWYNGPTVTYKITLVDSSVLTPTPTPCLGVLSPTNLYPYGSINAGTYNVTWDPVSNASYYSLRIDDLSNGWTGTCDTVNPGDVCTDVPVNSYIYEFLPGHSYRWWVHSRNGCGVWSEASVSNVNVPLPTPTPYIDRTLPVVNITYPTNNAILTKNRTISIIAQASDNVGVTKVEFYVNNVLTCTDTSSTYSCSWFIPNKTKVKYTISTKAYDLAGNIGTSTISITSK